MLSDDETRGVWQARWHHRLGELGIDDAANPPRGAVDFLTPHEQEDQRRRQPPLEMGDPEPAVPPEADG